MKYIIAFISTIIILSSLLVFNVYAAGSILLNNDNTSIASSFTQIQSQAVTALGSPSSYYVELGIDLPSANEKWYLKIYFQNDCTFNLPLSFPISGNSMTPQTAYQYARASCVRGNWNGLSTNNSWQTNTSTILSLSVNATVYILDQTVPISFNGQTYNPPENIQGDSFFVTKDGYTCNFGVFAGPGSTEVSMSGDLNEVTYFQTERYNVVISFIKNNQTYSYSVKSYLNWLYKSRLYISQSALAGDESNILEYFPKTIWYTEPVYVNDYMQGLRCYVSNQPDIVINPSFEEMTDYRSFNSITLNQLLGALNDSYSDLTMNDLFTELTFSFYTVNGTLAYSAVNDYSSLRNSGIEPIDDPEVPDQTKDADILNQYLTSNNNYLKWIKYGDDYIDPEFVEKTKGIDLTGLDTISLPEYTYRVETLDSEPMTFFGRLVEWFYSTPFSLIALVSLTFLVIRTILW